MKFMKNNVFLTLVLIALGVMAFPAHGQLNDQENRRKQAHEHYKQSLKDSATKCSQRVEGTLGNTIADANDFYELLATTHPDIDELYDKSSCFERIGELLDVSDFMGVIASLPTGGSIQEMMMIAGRALAIKVLKETVMGKINDFVNGTVCKVAGSISDAMTGFYQDFYRYFDLYKDKLDFDSFTSNAAYKSMIADKLAAAEHQRINSINKMKEKMKARAKSPSVSMPSSAELSAQVQAAYQQAINENPQLKAMMNGQQFSAPNRSQPIQQPVMDLSKPIINEKGAGEKKAQSKEDDQKKSYLERLGDIL